MDDELKNIPKCLVCLEKNKTLIKICSNKGKKLKIREIIKLHLWFEVHKIQFNNLHYLPNYIQIIIFFKCTCTCL